MGVGVENGFLVCNSLLGVPCRKFYGLCHHLASLCHCDKVHDGCDDSELTHVSKQSNAGLMINNTLI